MRNSKQSFLRMLNLRNFCIAAILAIFLVLAGSRTAFSANVSANFTVTDAKLYRWNSKDYELGIENGIGSDSFHAEIDWRYESETPIADGDTASFKFGDWDYATNGTDYHVRNSKDLPILDENGKLLGYWNITSRKINIRFTGAAVGHYVLTGHIATSADSTAVYGIVANDKVVSFPIADKRISFTKKAGSLKALGDGDGYGSLATNGVLYWSYYTPGITSNEFYKGNGQVELSEKAKLANLSYETTLSELATDVSISICALAQLPLNPNDATAGASSTSQWLSVTKLFKRIYQTEGQTYDEFFAAMNDGEYGVYKDENGRLKVAVKFGSQPSNITYKQAIASAGKGNIRVGETYQSMPEVKDTMNLLDTPGTVTDGKVLRFVVEIGEQIPAGSGGKRLTNSSDNVYTSEDGEDHNTVSNKTVTVPVGTATANIIGEARLRLVDENTGKPLPGRNFILQVQDGDEWKDVPGTERTTDADGRIQVLGLTPGKNYRWQQLDFADHYNADSLKVRLDQPTRRGVPANNPDFIMPTNAGISFTATNALQTYTVTYQLGDGSNDEDIVFTQYYGDTTKQPDMTTINVNEGYTFEGWSREIAPTVTENVTYVAKWSAVLDTRRGTDPETPAVTNPDSNVEPPLTYDALSRYIAILACSIALSFYFAPSTLRAYRVHKYRK